MDVVQGKKEEGVVFLWLCGGCVVGGGKNKRGSIFGTRLALTQIPVLITRSEMKH